MVGTVFSSLIVVIVAQGNQGPEGIHQDHEERQQASPKCRQNHHQEEQKVPDHQVQAQNSKVPLDTEG